MADLNPPSRPRRGVIAVVAACGLVALTTAVVVGGVEAPAEASGLTRFTSCDEFEQWGASSATRMERTGGFPETFVDTDSAETASTVAAAPVAADGSGGRGANEQVSTGSDGTGGTNVIVEGVDELDLVDRITGDLVLLAGPERLSAVDLAAAEVVSSAETPAGAQITFDSDASVAWVVGQTEANGSIDVARVPVAEDGTLGTAETWSSTGALVDARRVGDRLYVVATDGFIGPTGEPAVPFEDGPVSCDEILHPAGQSAPVATLLVALPVSGLLEPTHAAEVVGAGNLVHATTTAAYLATPLLDAGDRTAIHRFDLAELVHTGSGEVEGHLLDEFAMSDHNGSLRVAVTVGQAQFGPMTGGPILDGPTMDEDVTVEPGPVAPGTIVAPTDSDPLPPADPAINEVVVLETDGDLDVIGRTDRFGHPGETIHGIRFTGDVAYAVTFLQTDPFYVIDLADPTTPEVVGEVELLGFSSYLHPISADLVVGFGPGGDGQAAVKLFDVSDPAVPKVLDDLTLGNESSVLWDHHAFVDLGDGRFAVPSASYRTEFPPKCTPRRQAEAQASSEGIYQQLEILESSLDADPSPSAEAQLESLYDRLATIEQEGCLYPGAVPESAVVVMDVSGGQLAEETRQTVTSPQTAERVIPSSAGWALMAGTDLILLDESGAERSTLALG